MIVSFDLQWLKKTYFFTAVRRQIKDEDSEEGDAHAGDDEVDGVEKSLSSHRDVEGDIEIRFITASVEFHVAFGRHLDTGLPDETNGKLLENGPKFTVLELNF